MIGEGLTSTIAAVACSRAALPARAITVFVMRFACALTSTRSTSDTVCRAPAARRAKRQHACPRSNLAPGAATNVVWAGIASQTCTFRASVAPAFRTVIV